MNREEKDGWIVYWISITFIIACLALAMTGKADDTPDPCQWEINNAKSVCRALGRKSPECATAIDKIKMCRSEGSTDPLEGLQTAQWCETVCHTDSNGRTACITTCFDKRGRRT